MIPNKINHILDPLPEEELQKVQVAYFQLLKIICMSYIRTRL